MTSISNNMVNYFVKNEDILFGYTIEDLYWVYRDIANADIEMEKPFVEVLKDNNLDLRELIYMKNVLKVFVKDNWWLRIDSPPDIEINEEIPLRNVYDVKF